MPTTPSRMTTHVAQTAQASRPTRPTRTSGKQLQRRRTLVKLVDEYLMIHRSEAHSPKTIEWHSTALGLLLRFLDEEGVTLPHEFETSHLRAWVVWLSSPESVVRRPNRQGGTVRSKRMVHTYTRSAHAFCKWLLEEGVTRYEVRVRREALRELKLLGPDGQVQVCLDDPWEFLKHKKEVFAAVVGREEECPDAVNVAWIRLVVPQEDDTNSSRWPTDPLWRVVQDAPFADVPAEVRRLIRRKQRAQDVEKLNGIIYGCLASHVSLKHPNAGEWDISAALAEVAPALIRRSELPNKDFGTLARERRRERGLPVPARERLLPFFASREHEVQAHNGTLSDRDIHHASDAEPQRFVHMRLALAESHMAELLHALTVAEVAGASMRELERLEEAYLHELATYTAVQTQLQGMPLPEDR